MHGSVPENSTSEQGTSIWKPNEKSMWNGKNVQRVMSKSGRLCGTIVWESKRTKVFSEPWLRHGFPYRVRCQTSAARFCQSEW